MIIQKKITLSVIIVSIIITAILAFIIIKYRMENQCPEMYIIINESGKLVEDPGETYDLLEQYIDNHTYLLSLKQDVEYKSIKVFIKKEAKNTTEMEAWTFGDELAVNKNGTIYGRLRCI